MEIQEVNLVDTEAAQRLLYGGLEILWLAIDHTVAEDVSDLSADEDLVALASTHEPMDDEVRPVEKKRAKKRK